MLFNKKFRRNVFSIRNKWKRFNKKLEEMFLNKKLEGMFLIRN